MKKKQILFSVILVAVFAGAWYGYGEYNRKVKNIGEVKAQFHLEADELLHAFEKDETGANTLYLDKIIAVKGLIRSVEKDDKGNFTLVMGDGSSMSSVRCSMDSVHVKDVESVKEGNEITVKGACTGFNKDELLRSDVILNRCVIANKN